MGCWWRRALLDMTKGAVDTGAGGELGVAVDADLRLL